VVYHVQNCRMGISGTFSMLSILRWKGAITGSYGYFTSVMRKCGVLSVCSGIILSAG
jgi:hypothetical protein